LDRRDFTLPYVRLPEILPSPAEEVARRVCEVRAAEVWY
jgi:hypothetical protein